MKELSQSRQRDNSTPQFSDNGKTAQTSSTPVISKASSLEQASFPSNHPTSQSELIEKLSTVHGPKSEAVRLASLIMTKTPFQLKEFIAEGGEGFLFIVTADGRHDLIMKCFKEPPTQTLFCPEEEIRSYLREVEIPDLINHAQIPKIDQAIRISPESGLPVIAIVREKIEGLSLKDLIKSGEYRDPEKLLELLRSVTEILGHLHNHLDNRTGKKIIHSDIKPGNIMITDQGVPLLIDFGSARQIVPGQTFQHTVVLRGSLDYCPSEQLTGGGLPASDIYSLGITAYECLLGFIPPELKDNWKQSAPYQLPNNIQVSKEFRKVLEKMIHPDLDARYQNAAHLLKDIRSPEFTAAKTNYSWWSQLTAPWTSVRSEQVDFTPLPSLVVDEQPTPPRATEDMTPHMALETSQGLYKSFSANIKHSFKMRQNPQITGGKPPQNRIPTIDELSPKELTPIIPKITQQEDLESAFAALARHTSADEQYLNAFELLNRRLTTLNFKLNYARLSLRHNHATPHGLRILVEPTETSNPLDAQASSATHEERANTKLMSLRQLAQLICLIENIDTNIYGQDFVNQFLTDSLRASEVYIQKDTSIRSFNPSDESPVKAKSIICGAITSLLESKQIAPQSIDQQVITLLGNYLYSSSGRIPPIISDKFDRP